MRDRIVLGTKSAEVHEKLIDIGADLFILEKATEITRVGKKMQFGS